jgi:hypothetical protein
VTPFSDPADVPTDLSSPFQHPYIEVGMVMIRKKGAPSHLLGERTAVTISTV